MARAFSLAELLVVVGIVSLLIALMLPPLQMARRKTMQTACSAQLQQLGRALEGARTDYGFYPLWDDGGISVRYTWIDVLVQNQLLSSSGAPRPGSRRPVQRLGYCPADRLPDPLNSARHNDLIYPPRHDRAGIDYSYGIGVPLSAGGWAWKAGRGAGDDRPRRFPGYDQGASGRVLAGDAVTSAIYNLSGDALTTGIWNAPTQFDNTIAWRHPGGADGPAANLLFQDGHVEGVAYRVGERDPLNTSRYYVWHAGESPHVGPEDRYDDNWYPCAPPPSTATGHGSYPAELDPRWYTRNQRWTRVKPK